MKPTDLTAIAHKEHEARGRQRSRVLCCGSTACLASGGGAVRDGLTRALKLHGLEKNVPVVNTGCMGLCSLGPMMRLETHGEPDTLYQNMTAEAAHQVVDEQIVPIFQPGHNPAEPAVEAGPHDFPHLRASLSQARLGRGLDEHLLSQDIPFFTRQKKIVLARAGRIDPERIEDYIAHDGYTALAKALTMPPEQVCAELLASGLRGRGGAGFPVGQKWNHVRVAPGARKYVVANGDEGDPGAYMDRTLMEADPHSVLEGMIIAGYAVGAQQGYLYVRGEYPVAVKRLEKAIRSAYRQGVLGDEIFGSDFSFEVDIRIGAGAFVCGEETALMASVEGRRGTPRMRPPYPAQHGLWDAPTLINNVETFGNITAIINQGAAWFAAIGTEKSKGTKIFALTGRLNHTGLIEVPMGITLREIVYEIGGGIPNGRGFKAAQTGGPSGGCIPAEHLDTPVDYESLRALGSIMGSGGLVVMDDTSSMPDVAKFFMEFCVDESCGKCVPCRVGTVKMHRMLEQILAGQAQPADLDKLENLCRLVQRTSMCGLGQSAPNPVLSTLRYFRHEYDALVGQGG
ncbi:MAG: NAD(P)H-dependent oxidoreductase subunit E [Anaerolineales bacterium]|nr:NAD(P)H-dependent oxidoreductase subunit E [Anaerolineales bacterium]